MSTKTPKNSSRRPGAIYIEPDSLPVIIPVLIGALTVGGVSFLMSWDALRVVARWAGIADARTWGLPVAVDASILVFSALWLVARRRGISTWFHILAVTLFTLGSVGGNVAHALADGAGQGWQVTVGAIAAAAFPLTVFATTHAVAGLLVDPDAEVRPVRAPKRTKAAPAPTPTTASTTIPTAPTEPPALRAPSRPALTQNATAAGAGQDARSMPAAERALLRERAVEMAREGHSRSQIAEALGISKGTAVAWCAGITAESQEAVAV